MTTQRNVIHIPIYWLVVGMAVMICSPILSLVASVQISKSNQVEAERKAAIVETKTREDARLRTCELFAGLLNTYLETPPTTPAGLNVQKTYLDFYNTNGCQPPRTK